MEFDEYLDEPLNGAEAIGRTARFVDGKGKVDIKKTYYVLERGLIDAHKLGKHWVSTRRRVLRAFMGGAK